jgi:hypothetical protein
MADLYRMAPPYRAIDTDREAKRPIYFYIPAARFRNPKPIHDLGSRLTFLQPELPTEPFPEGFEPVTAGASLTELDARELGPLILGAMIPPKNRRARAWLQGCRVKLHEPQVLYFPFSRFHLDWKELNTGLSFQHTTLVETVEAPPR